MGVYRFFFSIVVTLIFLPAGTMAQESTDSLSAVQDTDTAREERAPIGLSGIELKEEEAQKNDPVKRFILPPYVSETTSNTEFKTVLPLFYLKERTGEGARKDLGVLPFYWAHDSKEMHARVYFPFYWMFRAPSFKTDIVLQTYFKRSENGYDFGFAPLFFMGKDTKAKTRYQVAIPPLYWNFVNPNGGFRLALLYYDYRDKSDFRRGFFPLYFSSKTRDKTVTTVLPPIFWHIRDDIKYTTSTVVTLVFVNTRERGWSFGILPVFYFARDVNWKRDMVMPFYYGSRVNDLQTHVFPALLSYYRKSKSLSQGGVMVFYHWYKYAGDYLQMFTPLYFRYGNTWTKEKAHLVPPLFYRKDTPISDDTMAGLIYWNFHQHHKERTFAIMPLFAFNKHLYENAYRAWVLPTFDFGKTPRGYHFWLHPLFYVGREKEKKHLVLVPLLWYFHKPEETDSVFFPIWWQFDKTKQNRLSRIVFPLWWQFDDRKHGKYTRILFPLYWDFNRVNKGLRTIVIPPLYYGSIDGKSAGHLVLNTWVHRGERAGNRFWYFNFFPIVSMGEPPVDEGARWSFLGGLAGWRRQGHSRELKLFWVPFSIDDHGDEEDEKVQKKAQQDARSGSRP